jgi:hypothetical protein
MRKLFSATAILCSLFGLGACVAPAPPGYAYAAPAPAVAVYGPPVVYGPVVGVGGCWRCGWRRW